MENKEISLEQAIVFLEMNAYEGSNAKAVLRMGDVHEVLKPIKGLIDKSAKMERHIEQLEQALDKATAKNPILSKAWKVKMTAKEMFEELGWKKMYESQCSIIYEKGFRTISFLHQSNNVNVVDSSGHIDMKLLKAINKQCKELGWI